MMSFLSQMFKSTENAPADDEMGMGRLVQMKDRAHGNDESHAEESHKDLLSRVKSAEIGGSAKQLRFRKEEVKAPLYTDWTNRLTA